MLYVLFVKIFSHLINSGSTNRRLIFPTYNLAQAIIADADGERNSRYSADRNIPSPHTYVGSRRDDRVNRSENAVT